MNAGGINGGVYQIPDDLFDVAADIANLCEFCGLYLDEEVRNSDVPVVVDFWAEWCGPCKQIGPILEELSDEMAGKVKVAKVDVDANQNAAMSMGVRGIPALFIFKDGEVISNRAGAAPKAALQKWIEDSI